MRVKGGQWGGAPAPQQFPPAATARAAGLPHPRPKPRRTTSPSSPPQKVHPPAPPMSRQRPTCTAARAGKDHHRHGRGGGGGARRPRRGRVRNVEGDGAAEPLWPPPADHPSPPLPKMIAPVGQRRRRAPAETAGPPRPREIMSAAAGRSAAAHPGRDGRALQGSVAVSPAVAEA
ncbi:hypothetical protein BU14_0023s0068 [Porphyra umbilicalis]|uniref:Uncharacterized protein n=1 Tax=Porphyra umbilicalis TaxID=2786 RepID=A0A1X6PK34_PORUM|nr:hypothetical protein BU14_0023s0068 [Porphyra umbilicalis]|eukprot:OSX81264.1 hypothetical protein BU14_0023s0068 [Porphyra umbilicalis]